MVTLGQVQNLQDIIEEVKDAVVLLSVGGAVISIISKDEGNKFQKIFDEICVELLIDKQEIISAGGSNFVENAIKLQVITRFTGLEFHGITPPQKFIDTPNYYKIPFTTRETSLLEEGETNPFVPVFDKIDAEINKYAAVTYYPVSIDNLDAQTRLSNPKRVDETDEEYENRIKGIKIDRIKEKFPQYTGELHARIISEHPRQLFFKGSPRILFDEPDEQYYNRIREVEIDRIKMIFPRIILEIKRDNPERDDETAEEYYDRIKTIVAEGYETNEEYEDRIEALIVATNKVPNISISQIKEDNPKRGDETDEEYENRIEGIIIKTIITPRIKIIFPKAVDETNEEYEDRIEALIEVTKAVISTSRIKKNNPKKDNETDEKYLGRINTIIKTSPIKIIPPKAVDETNEEYDDRINTIIKTFSIQVISPKAVNIIPPTAEDETNETDADYEDRIEAIIETIEIIDTEAVFPPKSDETVIEYANRLERIKNNLLSDLNVEIARRDCRYDFIRSRLDVVSNLSKESVYARGVLREEIRNDNGTYRIFNTFDISKNSGIPSDTSTNPGKSIAINSGGGWIESSNAPIDNHRLDVRCYGKTIEEAYDVAETFDLFIKSIQNVYVRLFDSRGRGKIRDRKVLTYVRKESGPSELLDRNVDWPTVYSVYILQAIEENIFKYEEDIEREK